MKLRNHTHLVIKAHLILAVLAKKNNLITMKWKISRTLQSPFISKLASENEKNIIHCFQQIIRDRNVKEGLLKNEFS